MSAQPFIVVIDDTEGTRFAVRRILEGAGFTVLEGASGEQGLALAQRGPALIVLDIHLPDMLGTEVARRLKDNPATREIPILHLSASSVSEHDRAVGLESGGDAYLAEPAEPELILATVRALLRRRAAQELTDKALKTRDEYLTIASHDVRGLLNNVQLSLAQQLRRANERSADPAALTLAIERSVQQVQNAMLLLEDLLDVSQIQSGGLRLHEEELDLCAVAREAAQRFSDQAAAASCALRVEADAPLPGRFDGLRVIQVLANLLSNAIKYAPGKPITISVARDGALARLSVQDGGPGIDPAQEQRLFERFQRGDQPYTRAGHGLGLWIVREIVALHGGSIAVRSVPGEGTTVSVSLPIAWAPAPGPAP